MGIMVRTCNSTFRTWRQADQEANLGCLKPYLRTNKQSKADKIRVKTPLNHRFSELREGVKLIYFNYSTAI